MPSIEAWEAFAGVGGVVIFLGGLVFGLQRLGLIGARKAPPTAGAAQTSPEASALIEATRQLVVTTEAIAARSEAMGRIHARLDGVTNELGGVRSEVAHVKGELAGINRNLHIIQEHLLNKP